jgi:hypothetical protein
MDTTMKALKTLLLSFLFLAVACHQQSETPEPLDYGYLSLNLSLTITSEEANGRTLAVNTDDFRVTIFAADGTEVMVFDPFSSAPAEVSLPTGEYYVEAHSNNLVDAAFENPYYFGRSDNFTIDKEELKSIDIEAELANTKVAINYSANVVNTFHSYTGTVTVVSSGASLFFAQGETREGYFLSSPLDIEVNLSYTKLDGTTIDRTFTASIADPQPKTLYNINVDATLEDGKVVFNITVDEEFDTVEIDLGAVVNFDGCVLSQFRVIEDDDIETWDFTLNSDGRADQIDFTGNNASETSSYMLTFNSDGNLVTAEDPAAYGKREVFTYDGNGFLVKREEYSENAGSFQLYRADDFTYNANGQLIEREEYYINTDGSRGSLEFLRKYFYLDSETKNPYRVEKHEDSGLDNVEYYTYDTHPNPILEAGIWGCDDCVDSELFAFADNNITSVSRLDADDSILIWVLQVTYTYNADGYPTRSDYLYVGGEDDGYGYSQTFDYQCN